MNPICKAWVQGVEEEEEEELVIIERVKYYAIYLCFQIVLFI